MKFNLLLGSGVSCEVLPNVKQITSEVLSFNIEKNRFIPESHIKEQQKIRDLIWRLKKILEDYYNYGSIPTHLTYEDYYYLLKEMYNNAYGQKYNPALDFLSQKVFDVNVIDYSKVLSECEKGMRKIEEILYEKLNYDINLLKTNIYPNLNNWFNTKKFKNIFTLNHDTLIEDFFTNNGLTVNDGFYGKERINGYIDGALYNKKLFLENQTRLNIIKLHGSIDWFNLDYFDDQKVYKKLNRDMPNANEFKMIIGNYNKVDDYYSYVFLDLFNFFYNELFKSNCLVISGYGFRDKYINNIINNWLYSEKENKFIIIDPFLEDECKKFTKTKPSERGDMDLRELYIYKMYNIHKSNNKINVVTKKFKDLSINDIEKFIN